MFIFQGRERERDTGRERQMNEKHRNNDGSAQSQLLHGQLRLCHSTSYWFKQIYRLLCGIWHAWAAQYSHLATLVRCYDLSDLINVHIHVMYIMTFQSIHPAKFNLFIPWLAAFSVRISLFIDQTFKLFEFVTTELKWHHIFNGMTCQNHYFTTFSFAFTLFCWM